MSETQTYTFELEAGDDGEPLPHKIDRLKKDATFRWLKCTGVMHPSKRTATVTFEPLELPPPAVRVRLILKNALRSHGLRAVAAFYGVPLDDRRTQ